MLMLKNFRKLAIVLALGAIVAACSHSAPEMPVERPGNGGSVDAPAAPDYTEELADRSVRLSIGDDCLRADEIGVLYMTDGAIYSFVRLDDSHRMDFSSEPAMLSVNGIRQTVVGLEHIGAESGLDWWAVALPSDTAIVVVGF